MEKKRYKNLRDAIKQLQREFMKKKLHQKLHTQYVGIVQDEIRLKSGLVYNKHTGELIGRLIFIFRPKSFT